MKLFFRKSVLAFIAGMMIMSSMLAQRSGAGIYGGGPFYKQRNTIVNELRNSGFTWVCVWTIHIEANGDLGFNGEFDLVKNGSYVGNSAYPNFPGDMAQLKTAPTSIQWIECGLSGWGSGTFDAVRNLVNSEGTGPGSTLYENFKALRDAIPAIDAFSFDDESTYHEPSTTQFAIMLADLGFKVSICPYTQVSHWQAVVANTNNARPGTIEDVHLQCYAGGSGNNPCTWDNYFASEINVMPGVEDGGSIAGYMSNWNNQCGIAGGWIWLYDDFYGNSNTVQSYSAAINNNITPISTNPPGQASNPNPANGATGASTSTTLNWTAGSGATSHNVYFGTSNPPVSQGNQAAASYNPGTLNTNTTYYWRVDEVNGYGTTTGIVWSFTTTATSEIDHTDPVGTGTITARAQISSNESAARAFDNLYTAGTQNSTWSKWLDNGGTPSTSNPSWIQIQLPTAVTVNKLAIISANDDYGRDPKDFNLQGSNNGTSWTALGSWSNQTFSSRFQKREFTFSNTNIYNYYKLNITKNDENVSMTQLCEIELYGPEGSSPVLPGLASSPGPANGATGVSITTDLSWTAGSGATSHGVYFGTDATPDNGEFKDFYSVTSFDPGTLAENTTYYWRVDEINSVGTTTGDVWSFTTGAESHCNTSPLSLSIHFDNYPEETSWTVKQGSTTVASGGTYGSEPDGSTKIETITLNGGDYTFTMTDSYGDGICCGYGSGSFTLTDNAGATILTGSNFGSSVSESFCIEGSSLKNRNEETISSLKDIEDYGLSIYPNPFKGTIKINAKVAINKVYLTNIQGKTLYEKEMNSKVKEVTFDHLQKGVYFLKVEYANGIKEIKKMIKD